MNPIDKIPPKDWQPTQSELLQEEVNQLKQKVSSNYNWAVTWFIIFVHTALLILFLWHEDVHALKFEAAVDKEAESRYFDAYRRRHNGSFPPEYYPPAPPRADDLKER